MSMQPPNDPGRQGHPPNTNHQPWQPQDYSQPTQLQPNYLPLQSFQQSPGPSQPGQFQSPPPTTSPDHRQRNAWLIIIAIMLGGLTLLGILSPPSPSPSNTSAVATPTVDLAISATALAQHNTNLTAVASTPTPTTLKPTATPTMKPPPTPTSVTGNLTATYGPPRLGGPISDFIGKYGKPNDHTDLAGRSFHWFRDSSSNADGLIVWELTHPNQVDSIDVQAVNGDMPNMSAAVALCTVYNPSDARQLKSIPLVNASGQASGVDVVYLSASLARVFSPDDFTDSQQNNVQPGTFDIQYLYKGDGTESIDSCSILPGEQQTQG